MEWKLYFKLLIEDKMVVKLLELYWGLGENVSERNRLGFFTVFLQPPQPSANLLISWLPPCDWLRHPLIKVRNYPWAEVSCEKSNWSKWRYPFWVWLLHSPHSPEAITLTMGLHVVFSSATAVLYIQKHTYFILPVVFIDSGCGRSMDTGWMAVCLRNMRSPMVEL